jgi:hypothetical protein
LSCRAPGGGTTKLTEVYPKLVLDKKIDAKEFELPK